MIKLKLPHLPQPAALGGALRCMVNRHEPRGHTANWNGTHYVSRCEHCRAPIRRVTQGKWVRDASIVPHLHPPALAGR